MDWFIWVISLEISVWMFVASLFKDAIACAFRLCFKASTTIMTLIYSKR